MKVKIISIPVQDQQKALEFYTKKLGFIKKADVPLGEDSSVSPGHHRHFIACTFRNALPKCKAINRVGLPTAITQNVLYLK